MRIFIYECVTAGGLGLDVPPSLLREGRAMLGAVSADFERMPGVEVVTIRVEERESFEERVRTCDATLVIAPEFDGLLESRTDMVLSFGGRLLGSLPRAIQLTADKLALAEFWRVRGVRHPWTAAAKSAELSKSRPPWVAKPRHGAGSLNTYLMHDSSMVETNPDRDQCIIQAFVPGQAASVALLMGKAQAVALCPARQHVAQDGHFHYLGGSLPLPAPLAERATRLAIQAVAGIDGLQGYVGVDLVLGNDGVDHVIEINPRLTTSYLGLRQLCQQNLAELMLRVVNGERIETPAWRAGEVSFRVDDF
jgi:tyramine---L-glutamate ligase